MTTEFLPLVEASAVMHVDVAELVAMVRRGELEHRESGRDLLVRPAILTRLGVRAR